MNFLPAPKPKCIMDSMKWQKIIAEENNTTIITGIIIGLNILSMQTNKIISGDGQYSLPKQRMPDLFFAT